MLRWVGVGLGFLTHGKRQSCAYCQYSNSPAHLYRLISLSFLPFRVCSKKKTLIRLCNLSLPWPVGIWCQNDVVSTSMRGHEVTLTFIRRHFTSCARWVFPCIHDNMAEIDGHRLCNRMTTVISMWNVCEYLY